MNIHADLRNRLTSLFTLLDRKAARGSLPRVGFLSEELAKALDRTNGDATTVRVSREIVEGFATAAVDVWLRAVQSFLVSCALTEASPIWASATGYYSSHYAIRAFAHLLGYFHLFRKRRILRLHSGRGTYHCFVESKGARDREHRFYWRAVKRDPQFACDPLFTQNDFERDRSDVGHRERANYADHVGQFPNFRAIDIEAMKQRIIHISRISFGSPPIPQLSHFPDVESVQVVAYHRIVRFRQVVDEAVSVRNRFWRVHRQPPWAGEMIDFQITEQGGLPPIPNRP
jgi:hypothetical protein